MSPLPLLLLLLPALAVDRERVMDLAAEFTTHEWTMSSANQYASCSSSYVSDYNPGTAYRGIPYDWGGWVTTAEYDAYLDQGYGAGSHSWHGSLWCTVGVDCSGFVSQAWETDIKYGTSTFYQVSHEISSGSLVRGDALNDAGSHIVLFAYQSAAGLPIHYEANGELVFADVDQGWSAFSSYVPIRYDHISDGSISGSFDDPIEISAFPYEHLGWTAGSPSDLIDAYSCAPDTDESGPERVYRFEVATAGQLDVRVSCDNDVDIDIHVLDAPRGDACLARDHTDVSVWLEPGEHWLVADTWVGSYEYAGPYILSASFTGTLGDAPEDGPDDTGDDTPLDTGLGDTGDPGDDDPGEPDLASPPPGARVPLVRQGSGCGCGAASGGGCVLAILGLLGAALRRRSALRRHQGP